MKFFKDNSYDAVKLLLNQIGIAIFSLAVCVAPSANGGFFAKFAIYFSILASVLYFILIYITTWEYGFKDKMQSDSGKITVVKNKGLKLALLANIPNFLLAGAAVIFMIIYMNSGNEIFNTLFFIFNLIVRFINAMFLGLLQGIFSFLPKNSNLSFLWQMVGYFLAPIFTVLVAHLGYELGRREIKIFGFINLSENTNNRE